MATVNVDNWQDFLTAAAVAGDTVNLPENAEWDIGELEPEGHSGAIILKATINGNGTKIKNLVINDGTSDGIIQITATVTDLHFVDGVWPVNQYVVRFMANDAIAQLCTFSASIQGGSTVYLFGTSLIGQQNKATVYRCAANIEFATATNAWFHGYNTQGKYNNMKISGSRITSVTVASTSSMNTNGKMEYSYMICDTPAVTTFTGAPCWWSLIRCTGSNVSTLANVGDSTGAKITLACSSDFPNAGTVSRGLSLCTESQLHDAAYLQSIGFPIGVEY